MDAAFRTSVITLNDGRVVSGLFRRNDSGTIVLADNQGQEMKISESDVDQHDRSQTSIMPGNFAETLPKESLNDLLAYLLSLREVAPKK